MKRIVTAKEFRDYWRQQNPKIIHLPSEFELGLMEAYAQYYHEAKQKSIDIKDKIKNWLEENAKECERFAKNAGKNQQYKDAVELEAMSITYKKAARGIDKLK